MCRISVPWLGELRSGTVGSAGTSDWLKANVVNPHLADIGLEHNPKVESHCRRLGLRTDDSVHLCPAADSFQNLFETRLRKGPARRSACPCTEQDGPGIRLPSLRRSSTRIAGASWYHSEPVAPGSDSIDVLECGLRDADYRAGRQNDAYRGGRREARAMSILAERDSVHDRAQPGRGESKFPG